MQPDLWQALEKNAPVKKEDGDCPAKNSEIQNEHHPESNIDKVNYNSLDCMEEYITSIENRGLSKTWDDICDYVLNNGESGQLNVKNLGEMYEAGLAASDKFKKKNNGQYYTPKDVATVMSKWLDEGEGYNVCDVACGTGALILNYLDYIGQKNAKNLLEEGRIYLYDYDKTALKICKTSLLAKYGKDLNDKIHAIHCDFLNKDVTLPKNCKTISNPPYAAIKEFGDDWNLTSVLCDSREWYAAFMEKIFNQSRSAVVITPFSFISGKKFYSLRKEMCDIGNGFIVSFDNVPGNIFCGRKHGIFNTNTANSVRAAITVFNKSNELKGFKISPLIRFKNKEREKLLQPSILEEEIGSERQVTGKTNREFKKIPKDMQDLYGKWTKDSAYTLRDFLSQNKTHYQINVPNTCRYNTTASHEKLNRGGIITLNISGEYEFYFIYCFINSSFAYWWWRIFDGGITYPANLLKDLPLPYNLVSDYEKEEFKKIAIEMINKEKDYVSTKVNAGAKQENIKFPKEYRELINNKIFQLLGTTGQTSSVFNKIHANNFFGESRRNE